MSVHENGGGHGCGTAARPNCTSDPMRAVAAADPEERVELQKELEALLKELQEDTVCKVEAEAWSFPCALDQGERRGVDSAFTTGNRDAVDQTGKVEVARIEQRKISIEVADGKERTISFASLTQEVVGKKHAQISAGTKTMHECRNPQ